jgi:hypothetical protein
VPDEYDDLFAAYVTALRGAKRDAEQWWTDAVEKEAAAGGPESGIEGLRRRWPLGLAAHPRVIAVYREFYLTCETLTEEREADAGPDTRLVDAGTLVTEWLLSPDTADLAELIAQLPYAPIGLDEEGNSV